MESTFCQSVSPCAPVALVGSGAIEASVPAKVVSVKVSDLAVSNKHYTWILVARNIAGLFERSGIFATGVAIPINEALPYKNEIPKSSIENDERVTREASERVVRESRERAAREASERAARLASRCVVPTLKDDSLSAARKALGKARCRLGRVSRLNSHGPLIVSRQSARPGAKLVHDAAVAVTLSPRRASATHH
jgi:hypothetical protein